MVNMIKADFYRLVRSKAIYIGVIIMLLMIASSIYLVEPGAMGVTGVVADSESNAEWDESPYSDLTYEEITSLSTSEIREMSLKRKDYKLDKDILKENMNMYYIFIFVVAILLTVDFSGGCVKNTLSSAISRNRYYSSKVVFITLCCTVLFFMNTYISYFANIIFNNKNLASSIGTVTKITLMQMPEVLALVSILAGIAFMVKKTSLFNTISIPLIMLGQIAMGFIVTIFNINDKIFNYDLQVMFRRLADNPSDSYLRNSYLLCGAVIVVFNVLGYLSFKKAEIK
ncbi:MAG: ABC transporter permease subunit [Lachnospiraceae bacterium]|nr:ABC transporter permease subunit [Lachnospiraceae bacterium]